MRTVKPSQDPERTRNDSLSTRRTHESSTCPRHAGHTGTRGCASVSVAREQKLGLEDLNLP